MRATLATVKVKPQPRPDGSTTRDIVVNSPTKAAMEIAIVFVPKRPA